MKRGPVFRPDSGLFEVQPMQTEPNIMRRTFGPGPEGKTCRTCRHFIRKHLAKSYFKCALRIQTSGPVTDHRAGWKACAKYEEARS